MPGRRSNGFGGQVYNLTGSDDASRQALADAAERYNAAGSQDRSGRNAGAARLAKQTALEGLYYIRAARVAMGMDPGPDVPSIDGQKAAGSVTEDRGGGIRGPQGRRITQSVVAHTQLLPRRPSRRTPGPGRPGTPSRGGSLRSSPGRGVWGSMMLFSTMFSEMAGVPYSAEAFAQGGDTGAGGDSGDQGDFGDSGDQGMDAGDSGADQGSIDNTDFTADGGGGDYGDFGGSDFGGGGLRRLRTSKPTDTPGTRTGFAPP